ncbi:MAG: flagellar hook protein FlgE [Acidobacteriota bacterium]
MASFSIPLTGLKADSTALNTIANNLANMNTTAFKAQSTSFSDLFYQEIGTSGAGDPVAVGAGVKVAANQIAFTQGSINSTGNASDVALNGNGFFVVSNGGGGYEYTRAGNFSIDSDGNLVTAAGLNVMGYPAVNGVVNTNAPLTALNIPIGQVQAPRATTSIAMTANLDASAPAGTSFPAQVTLYDSLGEAHTVNITFTQASTAAQPNTWNYSISLPASDYAGTPPAASTGNLSFDSSGNLVSATPTGGSIITLSSTAGSIPFTFSGLADGAADLSNLQWNLLGSDGTPNISQVATTSAVSGTLQDGYASGQYKDFSIGADGTVTASYSNGKSQNVGQLALADVPNEQGLQLLGDGNYGTTAASGTASIATSGANGLAKIQGGALEASNVNISSEFSNLIIAQRAFEANAKSVTTFDTVTQDTINMVH